jgi:hypothetical protein
MKTMIVLKNLHYYNQIGHVYHGIIYNDISMDIIVIALVKMTRSKAYKII